MQVEPRVYARCQDQAQDFMILLYFLPEVLNPKPEPLTLFLNLKQNFVPLRQEDVPVIWTCLAVSKKFEKEIFRVVFVFQLVCPRLLLRDLVAYVRA